MHCSLSNLCLKKLGLALAIESLSELVGMHSQRDALADVCCKLDHFLHEWLLCATMVAIWPNKGAPTIQSSPLSLTRIHM